MEKSPQVKRSVRRVRLSLRYKLLMILTLIPLVVLSLYLRLVTSDFEKDKEAYVYDSSVAVSKSLAMQIRVELEAYLSAVKPVVESYDATTGAMSPQGEDLFHRFPKISALVIFQGGSDGQYTKLAELKNSTGADAQLVSDTAMIERFRDNAATKGLVLSSDSRSDSSIVIGSRIGRPNDPTYLVLVGFYKAEALVSTFTKAQMYRNFLLDDVGRVALGTSKLAGTPLEGEDLAQFFKPVLDGKLPESSFGLSNKKKDIALVSYAVVGIGDLKVVSVVDRREALRAVDALIAKSILFFLALLAFTVLASLFASIQLTSTLRDLYEATRKIASGKFDVRVRSNSSDEIGGLADGFNVMAEEVSRLMSETAEKARMQNELATVKTVQETLFPPSENKFTNLEISGHFEPASECGGDWWSYSKIGNSIYMYIGDATGHGAPAALITSAARSAAAVIEGLEGMTPGKALQILNRAIHETSRGKINMTFFLAAFDETTGILTYANASHDPPYLIRRPKDRPVSKKDLIPLMDVNGLRLGEKIDSKYEEATVQLELNDSVVFYTDGIIDLQDSAGKKWGERTFIKNLVDSSADGHDLSQKMSFLRRSIANYRGEATLLDDITLFMAEYKESA